MTTHSRIALITFATVAVALAACDRRDPEPPEPRAPQAVAPATAPAADQTTLSGNPNTATAPGTERTAGELVDDASITTKVKTALLADPTVQGLRIDVDTREHQVTLSGTVQNRQQMDRALQLTREVHGVQGVSNQMTITQG